MKAWPVLTTRPGQSPDPKARALCKLDEREERILERLLDFRLRHRAGLFANELTGHACRHGEDAGPSADNEVRHLIFDVGDRDELLALHRELDLSQIRPCGQITELVLATISVGLFIAFSGETALQVGNVPIEDRVHVVPAAANVGKA